MNEQKTIKLNFVRLGVLKYQLGECAHSVHAPGLLAAVTHTRRHSCPVQELPCGCGTKTNPNQDRSQVFIGSTSPNAEQEQQESSRDVKAAAGLCEDGFVRTKNTHQHSSKQTDVSGFLYLLLIASACSDMNSLMWRGLLKAPPSMRGSISPSSPVQRVGW